MLTQKEMEQSPLFRDISYEEYLRMMDCFRATQRSYRADDLICDFTSPSAGNSVGIVERGSAALIRIDEEGVATVLEELGPGDFFFCPNGLWNGLENIGDTDLEFLSILLYKNPRDPE